MSTPHLPAEIHALIASYLAPDDLPAYRLAAKHLADIGAQFLFRDLTFHASSASLARIQYIARGSHLRDFVQTLTWDTSLVSPSPCTSILCFDQDAHAHHAALLADQQTVLSTLSTHLPALLAPFPNLHTISLGAYTSHPNNPTSLPPSSPPFSKPALQPLGTSRPPYTHLTDTLPLLTTLLALHSPSTCTSTPPPLTLTLPSLNYAIFRPAPYTTHLSPLPASPLTHLTLHFPLASPTHNPQDTSLALVNCARVLHAGHLAHFLRKFPVLEALSLDFDARSAGNGRAGVALGDVFRARDGEEKEGGGEVHTWHRLRSLAIAHADVDAGTMAALLGGHAGTLKRLALSDVCLEPPGSWAALLGEVRPGMVGALEEVEFGEWLFDARIEGFLRGRSALVGWWVGGGGEDLDLDLGRRLEGWMVRGGEGECPLWEGGKMTRVVGRVVERERDGGEE